MCSPCVVARLLRFREGVVGWDKGGLQRSPMRKRVFSRMLENLFKICSFGLAKTLGSRKVIPDVRKV